MRFFFVWGVGHCAQLRRMENNSNGQQLENSSNFRGSQSKEGIILVSNKLGARGSPQLRNENYDRYSPKSRPHNLYQLQPYYGGIDQFVEDQLDRSQQQPSLHHQHAQLASLNADTSIGNWQDNKNVISDLYYVQDFDDEAEGGGEEEGAEEDYDDSVKIRSNATFPRQRKPQNFGVRRVMEKNGGPNIRYKNVSERRRRFISDLYTTLIDSNWLMTLLLFAMSFYTTWVTFAIIYYLIIWIHGDLEPENLAAQFDANSNKTWNPCIIAVPDFASAFLFSLETQHTIGYGTRQTSNECPAAIVIMSLQSVIGCLIQAFMVGLVFAKLSRPKHRANTVVFSKNGVVCERDKQLCMIFRLGDMRHDSFIVGAQTSLKLIRRRGTTQGEIFDEITPLKISPNTMDEACLFLIWPLTVIHMIDEESPFYKMSSRDMASSKFELSLTLEGTIESTSMTFQARTSYLPNEILWGHRFEPMILYRNEHKKYQVNFSAFHSTYEVETPTCTAFELEEYYKVKSKPEARKWHNVARKQLHTSSTSPHFRPYITKNISSKICPPDYAEEMRKTQSNGELTVTSSAPQNNLNSSTNNPHQSDQPHCESSTSSASTCPESKPHGEQTRFDKFSISNENVVDA